MKTLPSTCFKVTLAIDIRRCGGIRRIVAFGPYAQNGRAFSNHQWTHNKIRWAFKTVQVVSEAGGGVIGISLCPDADPPPHHHTLRRRDRDIQCRKRIRTFKKAS